MNTFHVSERTAGYWRAGQRVPSKTSRKQIEAHFGLKEGWLESEADLPVWNLRFIEAKK